MDIKEIKSERVAEKYYKIKCKACETSNEYLNLEIDFGKAITINLFDCKYISFG